MDFDKLLEVVKASQVATLQAQITMLTELGKNTNTSYSTTIAAINTQIAAIQAL